MSDDRKKNVLILVAEVDTEDYTDVCENETRSRVVTDRYRSGWEGIFGKGIASKPNESNKSN